MVDGVEVVIQSAGYECYALAHFRAEITRRTSRRWRWRIWAAVGGAAIASGEARSPGAAKAVAIRGLCEVVEYATRNP